MKDCSHLAWLAWWEWPINNPGQRNSMGLPLHLTAAGYGAVGGVASDGTNPFVTHW